MSNSSQTSRVPRSYAPRHTGLPTTCATCSMTHSVVKMPWAAPGVRVAVLDGQLVLQTWLSMW